MNFYYWLGYHLSRLLASYFLGFELLIESALFRPAPCLTMNHQSFFDRHWLETLPTGHFFSRKKVVDECAGARVAFAEAQCHPGQFWKEATARAESIDSNPERGRVWRGFSRGREPRRESASGFARTGLLIAKTRAPVVPMRIFGAFDAWLDPRKKFICGAK